MTAISPIRDRLLRVAPAVAALALTGCGLTGRGQSAHASDKTQQEGLTVCGGSTTVQGVDVSEYDNETTTPAQLLDWRAARDAGLVFGIARVSDGLYHDPYFADNWAGMADAGVIRGAYQFFEAGEDITSQANLVIDAVGMLGTTDLPVTADIEGEPSGHVPTAEQLATWMALIEKGTGKLPIIYCGATYWDANFGSSTIFNNPLWVANWGVSCPAIPTTRSSWTFWQYNDVGTVVGFPKGDKADVDVFNGSTSQLLAFAASSAVSCQAAESHCSQDSDCCFGLTCQSGSCLTAPNACGNVQGSCARASDCCSGLSCQTWPPSGESPGLYCCYAVGAACSTGRDCCGGTPCTDGVCACVAQAGFCQNDDDCCSGLSCQGGACEAAPACGAIQSLCAQSSDCCSGLICQVRSPANGAPGAYCCEGVGVACTAGSQCCGGMNCTGGSCACVPEGQYCENDADCCGAETCQSQVCAATRSTAATSSSSASSIGSTSSGSTGSMGSGETGSSASASTGSVSATSGTSAVSGASSGPSTGTEGASGGSSFTSSSGGGATPSSISTAGTTSGGSSVGGTSGSTSGASTAGFDGGELREYDDDRQGEVGMRLNRCGRPWLERAARRRPGEAAPAHLRLTLRVEEPAGCSSD